MRNYFGAAFLLAGACAGPGSPGGPWRDLSGLDGWVAIGSARWRAEDGAIVGGQEGDPKRSGVLTTKEQFKDFEFELEFMIDEHGKYNSGIYLRNVPGRGGRSGYQVNIGRAEAEEYCGGVFTNKWLAKGDEKDAVRKKRDWNRMRIQARGPHVRVELNGVVVSDVTDLAPDPRFLQPGVIALQTYGAEGHAGWVKFRNLRVRELE